MLNFCRKPLLKANKKSLSMGNTRWAVQVVQQHISTRFIHISTALTPMQGDSNHSLKSMYGSSIIKQQRRRLFDENIVSDYESLVESQAYNLHDLTCTTPASHSSPYDEKLKDFKDHELLEEIVKRTGGDKDKTYCLNQLSRGIFRFEQSISSMSRQRLAEFKRLTHSLITAVFNLIKPSSHDDILTIVNEVFSSHHSSHTKHSMDILETIKVLKPKERRPQLSYLTTIGTRRVAEEPGQ